MKRGKRFITRPTLRVAPSGSFSQAVTVFVMLALAACSAWAAPDNAGSPLGTNLTRFVDWSTEWAFVDAFKQSRPWVSSAGKKWDDGRELDLDEHGWVRSLQPDQIARTLMFTNSGSGETYPAGRYTVLYEGEGTIEYKLGARKNTAASAPRRDIVDVDPAKGGIQLIISETNPENYIRNIRVIMPGGVSDDDPFEWTAQPSDGKAFVDCYETQVFHPLFLDSIRNYKVLRFMNWQIINEPEGGEWVKKGWSARPRMEDAQWTRNGVPVEVMCDLANRLHADPWFCMHHLADDALVEEFARLVNERLDPELHAYVEHSNEVWNGQYAQAKFARQRGEMLGLGKNPFHGQLLYHSERSVQIFTIWERVFGGTDRFVRVLASQAANAWASEEMLKHKRAYRDTDALGIAPYFSLADDEMDEEAMVRSTVPELADRLRKVALPRSYGWIEAQAELAEEYDVDLVAYEGGQHLVWARGFKDNPEINALFDAVNRDPVMGELYTEYLRKWRDLGGGMFVHFLNCMPWGKYGRWGALEYLTQPRDEAPKFQALQAFIDESRSR